MVSQYSLNLNKQYQQLRQAQRHSTAFQKHLLEFKQYLEEVILFLDQNHASSQVAMLKTQYFEKVKVQLIPTLTNPHVSQPSEHFYAIRQLNTFVNALQKQLWILSPLEYHTIRAITFPKIYSWTHLWVLIFKKNITVSQNSFWIPNKKHIGICLLIIFLGTYAYKRLPYRSNISLIAYDSTFPSYPGNNFPFGYESTYFESDSYYARTRTWVRHQLNRTITHDGTLQKLSVDLNIKPGEQLLYKIPLRMGWVLELKDMHFHSKDPNHTTHYSFEGFQEGWTTVNLRNTGEYKITEKTILDLRRLGTDPLFRHKIASLKRMDPLPDNLFTLQDLEKLLSLKNTIFTNKKKFNQILEKQGFDHLQQKMIRSASNRPLFAKREPLKQALIIFPQSPHESYRVELQTQTTPPPLF